MTALMHLAEHRFMKEQWTDMLNLVWAALGILYDHDKVGEQERRLAEIYGLLAWGYVKSGNSEYGHLYIAKCQKLLSAMPKEVSKLLEKKLKFIELEKEANQ